MLRLKVLGRFQLLRLGGDPVELRGLRDRALLVFLAMQASLQPRERIIGLLWHDRPEAQARQSLRQSLSALRRAGVPVIAAGKDRLALGTTFTCDATDFLQAAASRELRQLREAQGLYDGALFEDWHGNLPMFEDWLQLERRRLAELATAALLRLAGWNTPPLPPSERLFLSRKVLDIDPYREEAHRAEIQALAELGLRGEAVLRHQAFAQRLKSDLGVAVGPETMQLLGTIRRASSSPSAGPQPAAAPPARRSRLCILSLRRPAEQGDLDYLCFGIMSEIAAAMARFHSLDVIAPASVSALVAGAGDPLGAARDRLHADFVLDGTLAMADGRMAIDLFLHGLDSGLLIWNWKTEQALPDYRTLSAAIAHAVAQKIDTRIEEERSVAVHRSSPAELEGYDLWLRAQHLLLQWTKAGEDEAERMFKRALAAAPRLARAHSSLALCYNSRLLTQPGYGRDADDRRDALYHARLAVECDPRDPRSHLALMWVALWMCDHDRAQRHMQLAHELNPHSADVLVHVALVHASLGDPIAGKALAREAKSLNPLFPDWYSYMHSVILVLAEEHDAALAIGQPIAGQFLELAGWMAIAAALSGDVPKAAAWAGQLRQLIMANWVGPETPSARDVAEWFISVNRWLTGRERALMLAGLEKAGLL